MQAERTAAALAVALGAPARGRGPVGRCGLRRSQSAAAPPGTPTHRVGVDAALQAILDLRHQAAGCIQFRWRTWHHVNTAYPTAVAGGTEEQSGPEESAGAVFVPASLDIEAIEKESEFAELFKAADELKLRTLGAYGEPLAPD